MKKTFTWWDEFSPRDRRVSPQEMVSELGKIWEGAHGDSVEVEGSNLDSIHGLDGKRGWWTRFMVPHRCVIGGSVFVLTRYEVKENVSCRHLIVRPASPLCCMFSATPSSRRRYGNPHQCVIGGSVFVLTGYETKENTGCRHLIIRPASPLCYMFSATPSSWWRSCEFCAYFNILSEVGLIRL
ncbi:hypothetical protein CIPAW_02G121200 [Carya illinoinensis]|uniref:Uncharacterized protein n=1 Tax=Carya illinoinensis TaxID=32201 RepID=A0A8T1RFY6_CARIL|nr:hypothetical protein CIPAW_02G121200 [Carya illinoinensis]